MSRQRRPIGYCMICGTYGEMSYEHVPPKSAFNDRPVIRKTFEQAINEGMEPTGKGKIKQNGAGFYSLCGSCNNNTGAWYGKGYVEWAYQGFRFNERTRGKGLIDYPFFIFPLRVIKQIITMFFSINGNGFRIANPELVKFVLDPNQKYLSSRYKLYCYLKGEGGFRYNGVQGKLSLNTTSGISFSHPMVTSEISFPPFGYLLCFDCKEVVDWRLFDITWFSKFDYNEFKDVFLRLHRLDTHLLFSGDYRTKQEIMKKVE